MGTSPGGTCTRARSSSTHGGGRRGPRGYAVGRKLVLCMRNIPSNGDKERSMVKLVVGYEMPEDPAAFDAHYESTHIPLVDKIPNLRRFEAGKILSTPDGSVAP